MVIVVRVGPLPLGRRRTTRVRELERIFATAVELVEVFDAATLVAALGSHSVGAIALDASGLEDLAPVVAAAGPRPSFVRCGGASATAEVRLTSCSTATAVSPAISELRSRSAPSRWHGAPG